MEALSWACINHDVVESFYNQRIRSHYYHSTVYICYIASILNKAHKTAVYQIQPLYYVRTQNRARRHVCMFAVLCYA